MSSPTPLLPPLGDDRPADPASVPPLRHSTRELRTPQAWPSAPSADLLFGRDAPPPSLIVALWNLGRDPWLGPVKALAADPHEGEGRIAEVRLRRETDPEPLCVIHCTRHRAPAGTGSDTGTELAPTLGVVQIQADARQPAALRVVMTLLGHAHHTVMWTGDADDATLEAALAGLGAHLGQPAWQGAAPVWLQPNGSTASTGRRPTRRPPPGLITRPDGWPGTDPAPRSHAASAPWQSLQDWLGLRPPATAAATATGTAHDPATLTSLFTPAPTLPQPAPDAMAAEPCPGTPPAGADAAPPPPEIETELTPKKAARLQPDAPAHRPPGAAARPRRGAATDVDLPTGADTALALALQAPGTVLSALVDGRDGSVLAQQGDGDGLERAALLASALAQAHADQPGAETLHELGWSSALRHHLVLPVRHHPGLLLLAAVDREFGDAAAARWHLALARNQLG